MAWYNPVDWGKSIAGGIEKGVDKLFGSGELSADEQARKKLLEEQALKSGEFADYGEGGFRSLGGAADNARQNLADIASGKLSQSREILRQGLNQQLSNARSMAAGGGTPMAARTAAMNMGRAGYGMSGQASLAGIAEQQGAAKLLQDAILQQRQQELNAALGSRQNAMTGYGAGQPFTPEKGFIERNGAAIAAGLGVAAKSDKRAKTNIADGDDKANRAADALKAFTYKYKDERDGKGEQLGPMAQDLEKAGLSHTVTDTPSGKMVNGAKLALSNTAMLAAFNKRLRKLEGEG